MTLIFSYFRTRHMALLPPLFLAVFALVFLLYGLPLYAVGYACALCLPVYLAALAVSFARFCRRHRTLTTLLACADLCAGNLPEPRGIIEADYQALLRELTRLHESLLGQTQARYDERIAYYTLWAHQIKTPIAALRLQLAGQDTREARASLCELMRIEQYVEMALCYLRLDSNGTDYVFSLVELEPMVRSCARRFAPQFIARKLRLELVPMEGAAALTDEKWLAFVVDQLLMNAVKYTPAGGVIRVSASEGPVLCIEDTGIGIAAEDLPRIFERGFTGHNGRQDKRASGIGLYLCRRICDNLGHTLRCESEVGRGTRFFIGLEKREVLAE